MRVTCDRLTVRELNVLQLMVRGCTDRQIAGALRITRGTASNHVIVATKRGLTQARS